MICPLFLLALISKTAISFTVVDDLTNGTTDHVLDLQILDPNRTFVIDNFPVYFTCTFTAFGRNFSIHFARSETPQSPNLFSPHQQAIFKSYNSTHVNVTSKSPDSNQEYKASCVLYLNIAIYSRLPVDCSTPIVNEILPKSSNLTEIYQIMLSLEKTTKSSQTLLIEINLKANLSNPNGTSIYEAYLTESAFSPSMRRTKRASGNKKALHHLVVESCVHIHPAVFEKVKQVLDIDDRNYVEVFLKIFFAEKVRDVDKVLESLPSKDLFKINVVLNDLIIHPNYDHFLDSDENNYQDFVHRANDFIHDKHSSPGERDRCDHVFFIHAYNSTPVLGQAPLGLVCSKNHRTSVVKWRVFQIETVMAHELVHNLGADHDTKISELNTRDTSIESKFNCRLDREKVNLMHYAVASNKEYNLLSNCSAAQIKAKLFNQTNFKLLDSFKCLEKKKSSLGGNYFETNDKLVGSVLSLSDQCRFMYSDHASYSEQSQINCYNMECMREGKRFGSERVLDGTPCNKNKVCFSGSCQNVTEFEAYKYGLGGELQRFRYLTRLERAISTLRENCPSGASQEEYVKQYSSDMRVYNSCEKFVKKSNDLNYNRGVCCESQLKQEIIGCDRNECKAKTCETLKSNPCFNGGTCVSKFEERIISRKNKTKEMHPVGFSCFCKPGFSGKQNELI
jgi:hypothetical protein